MSTTRTTTRTTTSTPTQDVSAEIAYLIRALKAPTLRDSVTRVAQRARDESWTHKQYLIVCLQREVSARDSHGGEGRIRAARFPARKFPDRKNIEEFDFDHARGLKRDLTAAWWVSACVSIPANTSRSGLSCVMVIMAVLSSR
jgi:DNA replication protein DnaC